MIKKQNKAKYKKLETLFNDMVSAVMMKKVTNSYLAERYTKDIEKETMKAFGLKVSLKITNSPNIAYCMPSPIVASNVLISNDVREMLKDSTGDETSSKKAGKILDLLKKNPGTVDDKNAIVGGGFSKIPNTVVLDVNVLVNRFNTSGKELLAAYFHELGHLYTYYSYSYRVNSTNTFMLDVATTLKEEGKNFDIRKVTSIIKSKAKKADLPKEVYEDLKGTTTRAVYALQVARMFGDIGKSDIGDAALDNLESERLADAFVVSTGYFKDLSSIIVKITAPGTNFDKSGKRTTRAKVRTTKWTLSTILLSTALIVFLLPIAFIVILYVAFVVLIEAVMRAVIRALTGMRVISSFEKDESYDQLISRINKVYRNSIKLLKETDLSKRERADLVTDIVYVKELLDDIVKEPVTTSIMQDFSILMKNPMRTANVKSKLNEYMNSLEDLSANDFYLTHSQLTIL